MKAFRYLRDELFLLSCALYVCNRWYIKPHVHSPFLRCHFNDVLLIPCALPPLLLMQRWLKLRANDEMPTFAEIGLYLMVWSILFEAIGPHLIRTATGDPWDVVAYVGGGILAGGWWHKHQVFQLIRQ